MKTSIRNKATLWAILTVVTFSLLFMGGMALVGAGFFDYIARSFHYVYHMLFVRAFNYKTIIALAIMIIAFVLAGYWIVDASKKESIGFYEVLVPANSIVMPFVLLAAYRGKTLKIWEADSKFIVVVVIALLIIYALVSLCFLFVAFKTSHKERLAAIEAEERAQKEAEEKVEVEKAPVVEAKEEKPVVIEKVVVVEKKEPAPVAAPAAPKAKKVVRKPFAEKMAKASDDIKSTYNVLKNELISYGVKSRISHGADTFRLRKQEYAKITLVGKNLKLYVAVDPKKYEGTTFPVRDEGKKKCFATTPTMIKVKSTLSIKRAKMMIADLMTERGLIKGDVENVNYAKQLKARKPRVAKK